jgi:hypothetical protein
LEQIREHICADVVCKKAIETQTLSGSDLGIERIHVSPLRAMVFTFSSPKMSLVGECVSALPSYQKDLRQLDQIQNTSPFRGALLFIQERELSYSQR